MTESVHPSTDELSDFASGLLADTDADRVSAHAAECLLCADDLTALGDIAALLAEEGATAVAMPAGVAAKISAGLREAAAQRDTGVRSLSERRERAPAATRPRRSAWSLLAGAAATVVVGAASYGLLKGLPGSTDESSADSAGSAEAESGDAVLGNLQDSRGLDQPGQARTPRPRPVNKSTLPSYADGLDFVTKVAAAQRCPALPSGPAGVLTSAVRWRGAVAYVVVDRTERKATVFDCGNRLTELYSTTY